MKPPFTVELAEGGRALVMEGDPAYPLCVVMRGKGYTQLFLTLSTLLTGNTTHGGRLLMLHDSPDDREVREAATLDQSQDHTESGCAAHHYVVEEPYPEYVELRGVCKICGHERMFKRIDNFDFWEDNRMKGPAVAKRLADWNARYRDALAATR